MKESLKSAQPENTSSDVSQSVLQPDLNSMIPSTLKSNISVPRFDMQDAVNIANVLEKVDQRHNRYIESKKRKFKTHIRKTKKQMNQEYGKVMGRLDNINEMLSLMIKK